VRRLAETLVGAGISRFLRITALRIPAQHQHRHVMELFVRAHRSQDSHSIHSRHLHVENDGVRVLGAHHLERVSTIDGFAHVESIRLEVVLEHYSRIDVIVGNQDV